MAQAAEFALVPVVAGGRELQRANSLVETARALGPSSRHGLKNVSSRTLIHTRIAPERHGRAFAAWNGVRNAAELGALAIGGLVVGLIGPRPTLWLAGGLSALAGLAGLAVLTAWRGRVPEPEPGRGYDRLPVSTDAAVSVLARNAVHLLPEKGLDEKLKLGRPLRVKLGIDVTSPDIHVGRAIPLQRMRAFQDAGHVGVLIIGDYTTRIGDPSGRSAERPILDPEEIDRNAQDVPRPGADHPRPRPDGGAVQRGVAGGARLRRRSPPHADDNRLPDPRARRLRQADRRRTSRSRSPSSCTR